MKFDTFKRDRIILLSSATVVAGLSWVYLFHMAATMNDLTNVHTHAAMPSRDLWSMSEFATALVMWSVMTLAMMLPVASPWFLAFGQVAREQNSHAAPFPKVGVFLLGYGTIWLAYNVLAATCQGLLQRFALLSYDAMLTSPAVASVILIVAGTYQWMPLRDACLSYCRSPFGFLLSHWREGNRDVYLMGAWYGIYCVGCCWAIMALAFVFGVMNLLWMALVIAFLLIERAILTGAWLSKSAGVFLVAWGIWMIVIAP